MYTKEWRLVLLGFLLTFWSSPGQTFFISLFSADIRSTLSLSHAGFGSIYSIATLLSAIAILWSGILIDRVDLKKLITTVIICLAAAIVMLGFTTNIVWLLVCLFLLRQLGQGLMMLIASTTIVRYVDHHKGKSIALSGMGYVCAEAILPVLTLFLIAVIGWRHTLWTTAAALALFILPASIWLLKNHHKRHRVYLDTLSKLTDETPANQLTSGRNQQQTLKQWQRREVLKDRCFYLVLPAVIAQGMLFTGFIFHQLHIVEIKGWSLNLWGSLFVLYAFTGITFKLLTGVIIDKYDALRFIPYGTLPMACGLIALAISSHTFAAVVLMIGMGMSTGICTTLSAPFWSELYGNQYIASIKSLASSAIVFGTAVTPVAMGWLLDRGASIEIIVLGSISYVLVAMVMAMIALRIHRARIQPA